MDFLCAYAQKPVRRVIGLMSGTSADGIDAALVEVSGAGEETRATVLRFRKTPYPREVRERLFRLFEPESPAIEVCRMNFVVGEVFAQAALELMGEQRLGPGDVDLIASHGQTIYHLPDPEVGPGDIASASTLQIGGQK